MLILTICKISKKTLLVLSFIISLLIISNVQSQPIKVVSTTSMIGDLVHNIGGQYINSVTLMDSGVDPHLYRPTGGDVRALNQADIVFYNGYYLEGRMESILKKMARSRAIYAVAENIDFLFVYADEKAVDPHIWMDVSLWRKVAKYIYITLSKHLPHAKKDLQKNYQDYDSKLAKLNHQVMKQIASIPKEKRILITAHDAFSYFGRAYDIRVVGLQGINTADEFGINDLLRVQNLIIDHQVKAVFLESSVPPKFMKSLQKGLLQKNINIQIGGELFSDAMGKTGTFEGTYLGMMTHNAQIISDSLR